MWECCCWQNTSLTKLQAWLYILSIPCFLLVMIAQHCLAQDILWRATESQNVFTENLNISLEQSDEQRMWKSKLLWREGLCVEKKLQIINILMQLGSKDTHTHAEKTLESVPKSLLGGPGHLRLAEARHKPHPSVLTRGSRFLMQLQQGQGWVVEKPNDFPLIKTWCMRAVIGAWDDQQVTPTPGERERRPLYPQSHSSRGVG